MDDWRSEQASRHSRMWRLRESDAYGWLKLGLQVLVVFVVLFAIVLVILYFTEGPNTPNWVPY